MPLPSLMDINIIKHLIDVVNQKRKWRRGLLPAAVTLCVDLVVVHHLHSPISDVVHALYPQHLILGFELFGDALTGGKLFYQLKEHSLSLIVQNGKIAVQLAGG